MKAERKKRHTPQLPRSPINLKKPQTVPNFSGFLIIRLVPGVVSKRARRLNEVAREFKLVGLAALLKRYKLPSQRLVTSVSVDQLLKLEDRARQSEFAPVHSLTWYWRVDARAVTKPIEEVLAEFSDLPEVDFAYREQSVSDPEVNRSVNFSALQKYLDPAPTGIDARSAWTQGADGTGMHFIDLEKAWFLGHEDLPTPKLIFQSNAAKSGFIDSADHGTAVLGAIAGVDDGRGIVGIAPRLASVRVVSHFEAASGTDSHVADAIAAAVAAQPAPHVLLIEVQRGMPELPTESDVADFNAIGLAVSNGVIVIEAAGNSGTNLNKWLDAAGHKRMNRASADFLDSGAILVGAATSSTPHERLPESNFGSRVDCYGWGEDIVSAGYGDLHHSQGDNTRYTQAFGGTSGASAIIAGAALLVQGLHRKAKGSLLSPAQMRLLLSDRATATPQGPTTILKNIGVMPDLRQIIQNLLGL
jgi:subtilisin family serine protease